MRDFVVNHADQALYLLFLIALFVYIAVEHLRSAREDEEDRKEYERLRDQWFTKKTVEDIGSVTRMVAAHKNKEEV